MPDRRGQFGIGLARYLRGEDRVRLDQARERRIA
jgi:hypothetical protein